MVVDDLADEEVDRLLCRGKPSVSRLADGYPMSFSVVQKHVAVLERAGMLAKATRRGRVDRMADLLAR